MEVEGYKGGFFFSRCLFLTWHNKASRALSLRSLHINGRRKETGYFARREAHTFTAMAQECLLPQALRVHLGPRLKEQPPLAHACKSGMNL